MQWDSTLKDVRECASYIAENQWAVESNVRMQDVLATIARAIREICNIVEDLLPKAVSPSLESQPDAQKLSDLLCPPHASLDANGHLEPFDNCIACLRVQRDELLVENERLGKLLEKREGFWKPL